MGLMSDDSTVRYLSLAWIRELTREVAESEADAAWARSLGAAYGQGRFLGAPGELAETYLSPSQPIPLVDVVATEHTIDGLVAALVDILGAAG